MRIPVTISVLTAAAVVVVLLASGCETTPTQQGAVIGGATGAGLGAIIGNQRGKSGEGALIGGATGALAGALIGDKVDENRDKKATESATTTPSEKVVRGHYETRVVRTESGETYTERVWVEDK